MMDVIKKTKQLEDGVSFSEVSQRGPAALQPMYLNILLRPSQHLVQHRKPSIFAGWEKEWLLRQRSDPSSAHLVLFVSARFLLSSFFFTHTGSFHKAPASHKIVVSLYTFIYFLLVPRINLRASHAWGECPPLSHISSPSVVLHIKLLYGFSF